MRPHEHYIRKNYNKKSICIVNNLIRGVNSIPLDPNLLYRQSNIPMERYLNERKAHGKYHQFHNYTKILHFSNIRDILKTHDDVMEMIIYKINNKYNLDYYNGQLVFEFLELNDEYFNYEYYYNKYIDLCTQIPKKYVKLGLMMINNFPEKFVFIDNEVFLHELKIQQNSSKNKKGTIIANDIQIKTYFHDLFVKYDIIYEYVYCELCELLDYYTY